MAYPSRVTWDFRNLTKSFDFWPTLPSIQISDDALDITVCSLEVVDVNASIDFDDEDEIRVRANGVKIFGGHIKSCGKSMRSEVGPRTYGLQMQDYTAKLDDSVIDHEKTRRKEDVADRVAWILSFLNYSITTSNVSLPSGDVDAAEYGGMTVREALDQVADEMRLSYFVDFDKDLHMFRTETITAPFSLDDLTPDFIDSFPYTEFEEVTDSVELAERVYVQGEKRQLWVGTPGGQERSINDSELRTTAQLTAAGDRAIAENGTPQVDANLMCREPGLRAGMTVALKHDLWDLDRNYIVVGVEITAVDPHDENEEALLYSAVRLSDRRRARPRKNRRTKPTDSDVEDGDPVTVERWCHEAFSGRLGLASAFHYESIADEADFAGPDGPINHTIQQNSNPYNIPWTAGVCPLGLGGWGGKGFREQWFSFDPGDLVGVVGLRFTIELDDTEGFVTDIVYGVSQAEPSPYEQRDWDEAGRLPCEDGVHEGFIPSSMLVPSTTNYIGFAMGHDAQYTPGAWVCIQEESGINDVVSNGLFMSGGTTVDDFDLTLAVITGAGMTPWVGAEGQADGSNRVFTLVDWSGRGVPQARIGAVIMSNGTDYTYDEDTSEITFKTAPPDGSAVAFRYQA